MLAALAVLHLAGLVVTPTFAQGDNLLSVGQQICQIGIMAIGTTFVIVNGDIDLSVGSIHALGAILAGMAISDGVPWPVAALIGLTAGTAAGAVNGLATVYLGISSFIVTLGTLSVFRGIALLVSNGAPISLSDDQPRVAQFSLLGQGRLFGVLPMQLLLLAVCDGQS